MSHFINFGSFLIILSLILLTECTDDKFGETDTLGHPHYGAYGQNFWPILPSLDNLWNGLFYDVYCGDNCRSTGGPIPFHHQPKKSFKALRPIFDLFGNGYNYNYGVPNYSNNYGGGYPNHETNYGKPDEHFISPPSSAPAITNYDSAAPAYEAPRPSYEEADCANNKCGHVVFQPIIYVGPNSYDQKEISQESSEEEETTEETTSYKEEGYNEESNQYNEKEVNNSKEHYESEKEDKPSEEQYIEVEHKENNEYHEIPKQEPQYNPPAPYAPQMPYYSQPPCSQSWSQVAVPLITYMVPAPQSQYQMPFYNQPTPVTYNHQTYGPQSYQPCSACNNFGTTRYNAHVPPAPIAHTNVPLTSTHVFADPAYRTCPELFNNYNQHQAFKNYYY